MLFISTLTSAAPKFPVTCASCDGVKCPRLSANHLPCACGLCPVRIPPKVTMPPLLTPLGDADRLCKNDLCWCKMRRWSSRPVWCMNAEMMHGLQRRGRL
uniref:Secreted protein n=1 Tax=Plectus sambesii TaxID=2011161 RepID=A0A914W6M2_9BILA